jgi:carboxyl-terminal processing protease
MQIRWNNLEFFTFFFIGIFFLYSCEEEEIKPSASPTPEAQAINNFIWKSLNDVYLWEEYIPENIDRSQEFDPKEYFEKLLFKPTDRWSFITEDYESLINSFKGIEESFGHNFKLFLLSENNDVVGVVKYVVPNSPAADAGIQRCDLFYKVNGVTLNTSNYRELLFESSSYTLSFGSFNEVGEIVQEEDISLTSTVINENPIYINKTIEYDGYKIGYLSYNQFISDYNDSLVNVMEKFKADDISDLVLDLRYNPGGSISTAILLSSMIVPTEVATNNEVFSRLVWNDAVNDYWLEQEGEESDNLLSRFINPEVSLNLQTIYILVSSNTASASELVINCLRPYMNVVVIGPENTTGKYVGSITVQADDTDYENWAMQPIVLKTANANGVSDYFDGFAPDFKVEDDFNAPLGSIDEDMLATAIELITGFSISDPARISARYFPVNTNAIQTEQEMAKQRLIIDLNGYN